MRKLFVTDLDGTLLENHTSITDENCEFIQKLKKYNHCFAIATGRAYDHIDFLIEKYKMDVDYFILLNGALIIDKHNNIIKHDTIPTEVVENIVSEFYDEDWRMHFPTGFKSFSLNFEGERIVNPNAIIIEDVKELRQERISMVAMSYKKENPKYVDEICKRINNKFGEYIIAYRNVDYIDIVPAGCSKGSGVEYVKAKEKIVRENTFAIGDSWNDVSMFKSVEHSFTFNRAEKELQGKAKYLVDSVAECISKYVIENAS